MSFLKGTNQKEIWTWPSFNDIHTDEKEDIICAINDPILIPGRGFKFKFAESDLAKYSQLL